MNGILIIDKPRDWTSFDVIAKLRKKLGQRKIGHMGTLDPIATGVLPILLGDTAKFQIFVDDNSKSYDAKIKFGMTTDTLDISGKVISEVESQVKEDELRELVSKFVGESYQIPPMYSAIKKDGIKLCDLARKGIEIERERRKIFINSININSFDFKKQEAVISVECSKGTYIRTLCDDIGRELGYGATVLELRRTSSNGFDERVSVGMQDIMKKDLDEIIKEYILPTEELFKKLSIAEVTEAQKIRFQNGGALDIGRVRFSDSPKDRKRYKIYCNERFLGLGEVDSSGKELKVLKCLK